jgi:hypothetical protein
MRHPIAATVSGLAVALACVPALAQAPAQAGTTTRYELRAVARTTVPGEKEPLTLDTTFRYAWKTGEGKRELVCDGIELVIKKGDAVDSTVAMSRDEFAERSGSRRVNIKAADAPPKLKAILEESFGPVLCTLAVDAAGRELKRTVSDTPGARQMAEHGMIVNALLFHPPFGGGGKPWTAAREINMGNGGTAVGDLTYAPQPGGTGREVVVRVSGRLTRDRHPHPNGKVVIRNARYEVSGTQTYSPARREWVAGELTAIFSFDLDIPGGPAVPTKGKMAISLKTRD